ncbi:MAG TPA: hypothetical protein ENL34_11635 [Chloroflexi bacterium]|nr:hypothetical protein [Chloroflexota bacterium]
MSLICLLRSLLYTNFQSRVVSPIIGTEGQVVILDDLGYVQQSREEMEVLFTFLAERYERRSVVITSNLVFSEWDQIFKDPLTTAAAIDRVVHHSLIIEFGRDMKSVRAEEAARRNGIRLGSSDAAQDAES